MKLRAKLILSFLGLAVVPLAVITLYSYNSSLRALRTQRNRNRPPWPRT